MLGIPTGALVTLSVLEKDIETLSVAAVYPLQPILLEDETPGPFLYDRTFYGQDLVYPFTDAAVVRTGTWRVLDVATIRTQPVSVNPGQGLVFVARRLRIRASYSGGSYPSSIDAWMRPVYGNVMDNLPNLQFTDGPTGYEAGIRYLVIAHSDFAGDTFLTRSLTGWVRQRGYEDSIIYGNWLSSHAAWIKAKIDSVYRSHNPPLLRWVLLVGDYERLPMGSYPGTANNSDFYYAELSNDSAFPEVGVARLSVRPQTYELEAEVRRDTRVPEVATRHEPVADEDGLGSAQGHW